MDTPSISTVIVSVCTGLALLTPLVKACSQWHITLRKTPKKDAPATARQSHISTESSAVRVGRGWFFWVQLILYFVMVFGLVLLSSPFVTPHPATSHDVALIGMIVVAILQTSFNNNR